MYRGAFLRQGHQILAHQKTELSVVSAKLSCKSISCMIPQCDIKLMSLQVSMASLQLCVKELDAAL